MTWALGWSRLRESNSGPTHYEAVARSCMIMRRPAHTQSYIAVQRYLTLCSTPFRTPLILDFFGFRGRKSVWLTASIISSSSVMSTGLPNTEIVLKNGNSAHVTMHLIEGGEKEIRATLEQSLDAFFEFYPEI